MFVSKREFSETIGITIPMAIILLDRFCKITIRVHNICNTGRCNGRHYKFKVGRNELNEMLKYAENLSITAKRGIDRLKWKSASENIIKLIGV